MAVSGRYKLGLASAVFWTALVLGFYYWGHKPLTPALVRALGGAVLDTATAALFVWLAGGLGRRLLARLDLSAWSEGEVAAATALIGLGVLSLVILAVGVVSLTALSMGVLLVGLAVWLRRDLIAWLRGGIGWLRRGRLPQGGERFLAVTALILIAVALILSTLPPKAWDVLTYHLAGPQVYLHHGRFYAAPYNHFLGFPQLVETLYAGQWALTGRLTAAGPLHCLIGLLMLLMTGGYTARHAGQAAGWFAVAAILAATTIWLEMTFAYIDLMLMGLAMVGLAAADCLPAMGSKKFAILLGVIAGFALGTKYSALWLAVALGLLILWQSRRDGWRALIASGLLYGITALLVFAPWLVRNVIWYHNPVYPFGFRSAEMDRLRQDWYSQPHSGLIYTSNAWQIPVMPLMATIFGMDDSGIYSSAIGPLFLMVLPLLGLSWGRLPDDQRAVIRRALIVAGSVTLCWIGSAAFGSYINVQTRLVLYLFPPLAVVVGMTLESLRRLPDKPLNLGFITRVLVLLVMALTLIDGLRMGITSGVHAYFSARDTYREDYLDYALGWHSEAMRQVNQLPPGTHVRFLWEPRMLYCDLDRIDCRPDSLMDAWYYARRTVGSGDPAAIAQRWRSEGTQVLLVYEFGRSFERDNHFYSAADWSAWDVFVRDYLAETWRGANSAADVQYILYRWREES